MKKSELTQLTQIIEHLVAKEVRKQLPKLIGEVFQNVAGRTVVAENTRREYIGQQVEQQPIPSNTPLTEDPDEFKMSMRELFAGVTPTTARVEEASQPVRREQRHFTNNPVINQILNETTPDLKQRERMVGGAAFLGGYSPSVTMAASEMGGIVGAGEMMNEAEMPSFARNIPMMPGVNPGVPMNQPPRGMVTEGIPASAIPEGVSALDVARQVPLAQPVAQALTKNYSAMMKLIDSKRKRI